jgi:hypothetical protein
MPAYRAIGVSSVLAISQAEQMGVAAEKMGHTSPRKADMYIQP